MSKAFWFFSAIVLLLAGVVVYNKVIHPSASEAPQAGKGGPPKEMAVNAFVVMPTNIANTIVANGTLLPNEEVSLHPETAGRVTAINFTEGSSVSKGDLLVKLYDADLQAQLKKLLLQKEIAEKTTERLQQLLAINGIGQQEYDNALNQLNNIKADIDLVNSQITKTEIRAPFRGLIGLRNISNGAFVNSSTIVASIQQTDPLKVDFTVPEKYFQNIGKGSTIELEVDGYNSKVTGTVYAIEPKVEGETRSIKARALVKNAGTKLFAGAFAKITVPLRSTENALAVPSQCIIPEARNKKLIVIKDGKAKFTIVETGVRKEAMIQVTSGIMPGDTIVTTAIMYVKPDMDLKVTKIVQQ